MSFRWDNFLNKAIPAVEGAIGKEFVYNQFNDALSKMVAGYEKIANENAGIINPALAVGTGTFDSNQPIEQTNYPPNPNMREMPIGMQSSTENNPYAEVGKRPVQKNDLLKFYAMAQEEIGKLKSNPYDKGVYSGKLNDMYTKLTTKEKQEKIYDTMVAKDGSIYRINQVTGDMELVKQGTKDKKWKAYDYTIDDPNNPGSFITKQIFYNENDPNEILDMGSFTTPEELEKTSRGGRGGRSGVKKPNKFTGEDDQNAGEEDANSGTPTWKLPTSRIRKVPSKNAQAEIPQYIETEFERAAKEGNIQKIYDHYIAQYEAMGLDKVTKQEIIDYLDELYDLYYPKTDKQGTKK